ncbi:BsuPI-related putative proteinase inhibitor [Anaerobacillus isosaccharinicus]|uniref:Intracellular proteinase inhibitor BsuPI domain-containing protein n=1 Tax=Anaerobacillus isosaccharinicus TaxID=1532552 RepID=A0A1S2M379_9BACI|nr:BsuPI-related putative proteinase inhibitor [Anaerobacillus isosaccharinicus]MBA5588219.1 hypothetical protein [Anaerobacillus isosaccharinicus]QOY38333.1 hypothetical protein AWH56_012840 [Anaerobacillus isosaccharinicus]
MKKYWKVLSGITLAALLVTACGTEDTKEKEVGGSPDTGYEEPTEEQPEITIIEEGAIAVELVAKENADMKYLFKLVNTTDKDIDLSFASLQEFDYIIKSHAGEKVYQYSDDMAFGEAFVEKTIKANDFIVSEVDLTDVIPTLESGLYSIEIWSSARESDGFRTEINLEITTDAKVGVTTLVVSLVGIVDNNSVEIKDEAGKVKVYRITEEVKSYLSSIPENEPVTINFYEENGQLVISSIIVD